MMNRRIFLSGLSLLATLQFSGPQAKAQTLNLVSVVKGLDNPWGMVFLGDRSVLITERPGQLRRLTLQDNILGPPITGLPELDTNGQGGLLGIAVDPEFSNNHLVYLSFSEPREGGNVTAVLRAKLSADFTALSATRVIFRQNHVVDSDKHFGSRLVFDREGFLFVTTGERAIFPDEAQNPASHLGKILRITREGAPARGNPQIEGWAPEIWSIGHRNVQGAALQPETGQLWTAEHGAKGGDEINTPKAGRNYGWPVITYGRDYSGLPIGEGSAKTGLEQPLHYWDPSIAPSGMAFYTSDVYTDWKGNVFVGALAGQHLARLTLDGTRIVAVEKLFEGFARIRDVAQSPDGLLYVLTDEGAPNGGLYQIAAPGEVTASP